MAAIKGTEAEAPIPTVFEPTVARFGPGSCVSTWRSSEGHCIMRTDCQNVDISQFDFGLICVDADGKRMKHSFGRDSFDASETFDTLAGCSQCLGSDDVRRKAELVEKKRWKTA